MRKMQTSLEDKQKFTEIVSRLINFLFDPKSEPEIAEKWDSVEDPNEEYMMPVERLAWKLKTIIQSEMQLPPPFVYEKREKGFVQFKDMPRVNIKRCRPKDHIRSTVPEWIYSIEEI